MTAVARQHRRERLAMVAAVRALAPYTPRWDIESTGLGMYTATWRSADGRHVRCITAPTPGELASRLATADQEVTR